METNLISVIIVVLAINFLGVVFAEPDIDLLHYGAGIALPITGLAFFIGVRIWGKSKEKERHRNVHDDQ